MALLFTFCHVAAATTNVSVTATPSNPTAPATVTLAASGDSDGNPIMVTKVEYFNGTTSLGVSVQSPFTLTLNNLAAGTYQVSVKVTTTDPANPVLQSVPLALTVGTAPGAATAYFIHTDQLNTPRAITDGSGKLVWQWDSDPFGKDAPNEQPAGQPAFTFNQRFPGQQFDRESNLHYNYFRDYDPALGRYIQSDPKGLAAGANTFGYVFANPLRNIDPLGLQADPGDGLTSSRRAPGLPDYQGEASRQVATRIWNAGRNMANAASDAVSDGIAYMRSRKKSVEAGRDAGRQANKCPEDPNDPNGRCEKVKAMCITLCTDSSIPTNNRTDQGMPFFICVKTCVETAGCEGS